LEEQQVRSSICRGLTGTTLVDSISGTNVENQFSNWRHN
jgi:hypothetical protein